MRGGGPGSIPRRLRPAGGPGRGPAGLLLWIAGAVWLTPALGLLVTSLRAAPDNAARGWWTVLLHPARLTLGAYRMLLESRDPDMAGALVNTFLITVPAALLVVALSALAAYALAWIDFPGRDAIFLAVVGLLGVPLQMGLVPVAGLYNRLGIFGTIPGVVLFHAAYGLPFGVFLLRNFFAGIPPELLEAARIDGAGEARIFLRVVLPLGAPALASLLIFQFLWVWNDLLVALVFAGPGSAPLTVAIRDQLRQFGSNRELIASGAFLQMAVPLLIFFSFQRAFVRGLLAGSSK